METTPKKSAPAARLGAIIRAYRLHLGWTQKKLAVLLSTSGPRVCMMECGRAEPTPAERALLEQLFGWPLTPQGNGWVEYSVGGVPGCGCINCRAERSLLSAAGSDSGEHLTTDQDDPRLGHGADTLPAPQNEVYLVLSEEERTQGFVRLVRSSYKHDACGVVTTLGQAPAETYARDPKFYGATLLGEFTWDETWDETTE